MNIVKSLRFWILLSILLHLIFVLIAGFLQSDAQDAVEEKVITFDLRPETVETVDRENKELPAPTSKEMAQPQRLPQLQPPTEPKQPEEPSEEKEELAEVDQEDVRRILENREKRKIPQDFMLKQPLPPSPPQPSDPGNSPEEDFSEVESEMDGMGISEDVAFDVTDFESFEEYARHIKQRVRRRWYPPVAFWQLGSIWGDCKIKFRIQKDGSITDLELIESTTKGTRGHKSLDESALNAVKSAADFKPLPPDFPEESLGVMFTFNYIVR